MKSVYKRILIKISGEALAGKDKTGIDDDVLEAIGRRIKALREEMGVEVAIVVGGGNFWRGAKNPEFDRTDADHMGMLATVMNALALADKLRDLGMKPFPMAAIQMDRICEFYVKSKADAHLKEGGVVILGCGTGSPYFTTDTGAALRAAEL
ncbi:MAG: UMP kinase, partial [Clostridia bacterium]|nr:UMP kinase [Clostridia bacterium]